MFVLYIVERDHCCLAKSNMFTKYDGISQKAKVRLIRKHAQRYIFDDFAANNLVQSTYGLTIFCNGATN